MAAPFREQLQEYHYTAVTLEEQHRWTYYFFKKKIIYTKIKNKT